MNLYTILCVKKTQNTNPSYMNINIGGIKEIEYILPTEEVMVEWAKDSLKKVLKNEEVTPVLVRISKENFEKAVKSLYKKIGKPISLQEGCSNLYRIPTKKNGAFYKEIEKIVLYEKDFDFETIVIYY